MSTSGLRLPRDKLQGPPLPLTANDTEATVQSPSVQLLCPPTHADSCTRVHLPGSTHPAADGAPAALQSGGRGRGCGGPGPCPPDGSAGVEVWAGAGHCWGCSAGQGSECKAACRVGLGPAHSLWSWWQERGQDGRQWLAQGWVEGGRCQTGLALRLGPGLGCAGYLTWTVKGPGRTLEVQEQHRGQPSPALPGGCPSAPPQHLGPQGCRTPVWRLPLAILVDIQQLGGVTRGGGTGVQQQALVLGQVLGRGLLGLAGTM